jgi:CheY-like chemotaxis protein
MLPEKKQVLIVDDEPNLRKILCAQLSRDGYDVLTAAWDRAERGRSGARGSCADEATLTTWISRAVTTPTESAIFVGEG